MMHLVVILPLKPVTGVMMDLLSAHESLVAVHGQIWVLYMYLGRLRSETSRKVANEGREEFGISL